MCLQAQLADTVGESTNQKMKKDEIISILRIEKNELMKSVETMNKDSSPLKRKLAEMNSDLHSKTKELTIAYSKLAEIQRKIEEEEKIRIEKEKQLALEKQIEDRIAAKMTEWENLEKQKEEVRISERAAEAKRIALLEHTIREKEEKEKECCIMWSAPPIYSSLRIAGSEGDRRYSV